MFGYVIVNKPEMKFKDFDVYRSFYCGLCRELKRKYGISGQLSLTYDMTFLTILLSGLYEPETKTGTTRCAVHPVHRQHTRQNEITGYAADMNILLTYYKCMDDWKDEKKLFQRGYAGILKKKDKNLERFYEKKASVIVTHLEELSKLEKEGETDIDRVSGCFGRIMEELFVYREDVWEPTLRRMGFYLGKFIYLLDAYDDVEKDREKGNYNPFAERYMLKGFEEEVQGLLTMMLAQACREFEKLPIIEYGDILRNILYSGVWCRFWDITKKRREEQEKKSC